MNEKMSRWGVGPMFAVISLLYGGTMIFLTWKFPIFRISSVPYRYLIIAGTALMVIGLPFKIYSIISVMRAYNSDDIVTGGIYRCCRHPLYSSWVVFIAPALVLFSKSLIGISTPIFMYALLRFLVIDEEVYLEERFGDRYRSYRMRTPVILPYGIFQKKSGAFINNKQ